MLLSVAVLVGCVLLTVAGDYFVKLASAQAGGLWTPRFALGAALYALPAVGWFHLMRGHSLASIGVLYSASTILLMAALGVVAFGEGMSRPKAAALVMALAAVALVWWDEA